MKDTVTGQVRSGLAGAEVEFADISDAEIVAYVASGEPLSVAGGFTHEGKSAAFINRMTGDSPAVGGISLALLRKFALDMIIEWTQLWDL
jgi:septum formation protein